MSILIPGMEMPKKYPVTVTIFPDGVSVVKTISGRRFTATAIPVPPHRRLIDADAFIKEECNNCDGNCECVPCDCLNCKRDCRCEFIIDIADAPTIIPADKEGEE